MIPDRNSDVQGKLKSKESSKFVGWKKVNKHRLYKAMIIVLWDFKINICIEMSTLGKNKDWKF